MIRFTDFVETLSEDIKPSNKEIHYSDLDGVLVHHDDSKLRVHVVNAAGERTHTLSSLEYNTHRLPKDHKYDYSEFRSSDVFGKSASPITKVIKKMQNLHDKGHKVEILTARADMDDKYKFAHHMAKFGIDIDKIHVRRSGNDQTSKNPAERKKKVIADAIQKRNLNKIHLYDDSKENLNAIASLNKKFKDVEFNLHHIKYDPKTGKTEIKTQVIKPVPKE